MAIAFAIASGADPRAGLVTAAVAGAVVALLGGSRVQVVGPTGAFVVILAAIALEHGFPKLLVATFMAGVLLFLFGFFRLGTLIKVIPYPVTTGFTAGIAVIIFLGQLPHLLGLRLNELSVSVPSETLPKLEVIGEHAARTAPWAVGFALATILIIQGAKRWTPRLPGPPVALLLLTAAAAYLFPGKVQTVGDLYPHLPSETGLPRFHGVDLSLGTLEEMFVPAVTIALLGAIESLLSAVVADGMIGTRHDSNQELMAQGVANMATPLVGGIAATGAIARTATNVQNGARTPIAALTHAGVVFAVLLAAAPLAAKIPMAVLGGILAVVSWNMSERHRFAQLLKMPAPDAGVMLATFILTVVIDLTVAVIVGMLLAAALFIARMTRLTRFDLQGGDPSTRPQRDLEIGEIPPGVLVYSIDGPFFFGAAENFQEAIGTVGGAGPRVIVFRMRRVPYMDATGLNALSVAITQLQRAGVQVILSAVQSQPLDMMMRSGFTRLVGDENIRPNIDTALERARTLLAGPSGPGAP